jgi:hypothetical protein
MAYYIDNVRYKPSEMTWDLMCKAGTLYVSERDDDALPEQTMEQVDKAPNQILENLGCFRKNSILKEVFFYLFCLSVPFFIASPFFVLEYLFLK